MTQMTGYARVTLGRESLWIRFEEVGARERFNILLKAFRDSFPLTIWDENMKSWRLPKTKTKEVTIFCNQVFGPGHIRYERYDSIVSSARQLALSF
jgi:hypothetical protein